MVRVELSASPKFKSQISNPSYTTTEEDLPPKTTLLPGYPNVGDDISDPVSGRSWTVVRIGWIIGEEQPIIIVE